MAKILFLSNIPTPYQIEFLDQLAMRHEVKAFFLWEKEENRDWQLVSRSYLLIRPHAGWLPTFIALCNQLRRFRPHVIIIGGYKLPHAEWFKWAAILTGAKVAYWLEKPLPQTRIKSFLRTLVWILRLPPAYGVAAIGQDAVETYRPYCRTVLNLPYSINVQRYAPSAEIVEGQPVKFLFVGQFIHRKGVKELLEAFIRLAPEKAELSLAGSGELQTMVEDYANTRANINFLGFVNPNELPELYAAHHVLLVPSRHDGWAVVVCEAMASSMAVIGTSQTGAFAEFVHHGENGFQCKVDSDDIYHWMNQYCRDIKLVRQHGQASRMKMEGSKANASVAARELSIWLSLD